MREYVKINTLFKRDMTNKGKIIEDDWSLPEFEYLQYNLWTFTEKVDGTNIRIGFSTDGERLDFGGRTKDAQIPATLISALQSLFTYEKFSEVFPDKPDVVLYGEGYGPKIQNGGNYRKDQSFVLFDILIGDWWLKREDIECIAKQLGIDVVPIIGEGTIQDAIKIVKDGMKSQWGDFTSEGIVLRPKVELRARGGSRIIAKIKDKDFR